MRVNLDEAESPSRQQVEQDSQITVQYSSALTTMTSSGFDHRNVAQDQQNVRVSTASIDYGNLIYYIRKVLILQIIFQN